MKKFILVFALCVWGLSMQEMTAQNSLTIYLPEIPAKKQVLAAVLLYTKVDTVFTRIDTVLLYSRTELYATKDSGAQSSTLFLFQKQPEEENFRCSFICSFPQEALQQIRILIQNLEPEGLRQYYQEQQFSSPTQWQNWPAR